MKLLQLILSFINRILDGLAKREKRQEQQDHENDVREVQENPADWFDSHFNGGVRNDRLPDDAAKAEQANAGQHGKNARGRDKDQP